MINEDHLNPWPDTDRFKNGITMEISMGDVHLFGWEMIIHGFWRVRALAFLFYGNVSNHLVCPLERYGKSVKVGSVININNAIPTFFKIAGVVIKSDILSGSVSRETGLG